MIRSRSFRLAISSSVIALAGLVAGAAFAPALAQPKPAGAKPAGSAKPAATTKATAKPLGSMKPNATAKPAASAKPAATAKPAKPLTDKQKKDEAKKAYKEAESKFEKGDFAGALPLYQRANELVPGAAPQFKIAACQDKLSSVSDAYASYDAFIKLNPDEKKFGDRITEAKARMEALSKTPAKVKIAVAPPGLTDVKASLDGAAQAGLELSVPPGDHTIVVTATGYDPSTVPFKVAFAENKEIPITLNKTPEPVATVVPTATATAAPTETAVASVAPTATATAAPTGERSNVPAYVTLGLAGAGAIVGTIFGVSALTSKSDFDKNPTTEKADEVDRNALIADMSFAVALTFGVTGIVLLVSDSGSSTPPAKTGMANTTVQPKKKNPLQRGFVAPYVTPTGGGAAARFEF